MCSIRFLLAISIASAQLWYVEAFEYSAFVIGRDGSLCRPRICRLNCDYGLQLDDNWCPFCQCVEPFIFATTPETETETTTPEPTDPPTTTPVTTTTTEEEEEVECEPCRSLCMFGYEKDPYTGCNICGRCINMGPRPGPGGRGGLFGPSVDMSSSMSTASRGSENSLESDEEEEEDWRVTEENEREMEEDCEFACIAQWDPVCGRNGRNYSNACVKRQQECKSGGKIMLRKYGEC